MCVLLLGRPLGIGQTSRNTVTGPRTFPSDPFPVRVGQENGKRTQYTKEATENTQDVVQSRKQLPEVQNDTTRTHTPR